jgi:hydrogenase expression/formation protein HypC
MRVAPKATEADDHACITCADFASEARVIEMLDDDFARVEVGDKVEMVRVALVEAHPGDSILIHAGEAIARLTG